MTSERDEPPPRRNRVGLEEAARRRLGRNLRLLYASVLSQPLPDRFSQLLDELGARSAQETITTERGDREGSR